MSRSDRPVLLNSSETEGEGKSYVAEYLAECFDMEGKKTLLVEGNRLRPILATVFDVKDTEGLSSLILVHDALAVNVDDLVINTQITTLAVAPAGSELGDPAQSLAGSTFKTFLDTVRHTFDLILIDGPAMADECEAGLIAELDTGVVIVTQEYGP